MGDLTGAAMRRMAEGVPKTVASIGFAGMLADSVLKHWASPLGRRQQKRRHEAGVLR
jgi:hypothetical protein